MKVNNANFFQAIELLMHDVTEIKVNMEAILSRDSSSDTELPAQLSHEPIDIEDVCKLTRKKRSTLYKMCSRGDIPCYKHGKKLYFFKDEVINWIRECKKPSFEELLKEADSYSRRKRLA